ncbi:hypothetical protein BD309DRAFT_1010253 [Dichomitus squalens]|nr:hypothetical protein BD309DRAFT_1010253 [Dichomitus squalens]
MSVGVTPLRSADFVRDPSAQNAVSSSQVMEAENGGRARPVWQPGWEWEWAGIARQILRSRPLMGERETDGNSGKGEADISAGSRSTSTEILKLAYKSASARAQILSEPVELSMGPHSAFERILQSPKLRRPVQLRGKCDDQSYRGKFTSQIHNPRAPEDGRAAQILRTQDAGRIQSSFDGCDGLAEPAVYGKVPTSFLVPVVFQEPSASIDTTFEALCEGGVEGQEGRPSNDKLSRGTPEMYKNLLLSKNVKTLFLPSPSLPTPFRLLVRYLTSAAYMRSL